MAPGIEVIIGTDKCHHRTLGVGGAAVDVLNSGPDDSILGRHRLDPPALVAGLNVNRTPTLTASRVDDSIHTDHGPRTKGVDGAHGVQCLLTEADAVAGVPFGERLGDDNRPVTFVQKHVVTLLELSE